MFQQNKSDRTGLSLGKERTVHGVTVRKMPLGAYLRAVERLRELPQDLLEAAFPGLELASVLEAVLQLDQEKLTLICGRLLTAVPVYLVGFLAELLGCEVDQLTVDPEIGLVGLVEILLAFAEVNRLGELLGAIRRIQRAFLPPWTSTGSSG